MQDAHRNVGGPVRLIFAALIALFCLANGPSAVAQTSMTVTTTGPSSGANACDSPFNAVFSIDASGDVNFVETAASAGSGNDFCFAGSGAQGNPGQETTAATQYAPFLAANNTMTSAQLLSFQDGTYVLGTTQAQYSNTVGNGAICYHGAGNCTGNTGGGDEFDVVISGTGTNTSVTIEPATGGPVITFGDPQITPEPASYFLFGTGLLILGGIFRKKIGSGHTV